MFKVGDKVRLICDKSEISEIYHYLFDKILTVKECGLMNSSKIWLLRIKECPINSWWIIDWFELVKENETEYCFNCKADLRNNQSDYYERACKKCGDRLKEIDQQPDNELKSELREMPEPFTNGQYAKIKELILKSLSEFAGKNIALEATIRVLQDQIDELKKDVKTLDIAVEFNTTNNDAKHLRIVCELLKFRAENDKNSLSWDTSTYMNYFISFNHNISRYELKSSNKYCENISAVYFSSEELAQSALDMLKRKGLVQC